MKYLTFLIVLLSCVHCDSFGQTDSLKTNEYITIIAKPNKVSISYSNGVFEEKKISNRSSDFTGVLDVIVKFEEQGFELFTNDFQTYGVTESMYVNYFLMRKKKKK